MSESAVLDFLQKEGDSFDRGGVWTGRVESVDDPDRMNRVRVRIFHLHGDKRQTPLEALPWAEVSDFGGGAPDSGSGGAKYIVGANVWVMFEMKDERFPVVLGGRRASAAARDDKNALEFTTVDGEDESTTEKSWLPEEGNQLPKDIFDNAADEDRHPTRTVWSKSIKGHTILVEDRDGEEFLHIIDRAGQAIEMSCPTVARTANGDDLNQRGARSSLKNDQLPQSDLVNGRAYIRLKDVAGQEIILDGGSGNEEVRITSKNRQGTVSQSITLSSRKGREKVEIKDKAGNYLLMDPNSPSTFIVSDYSGNRMELDAENGVSKYIAANSAEETVGSNKTTRIGGLHKETIVGDEQTQVLGNKFLEILNDITTTVAGLTSLVLTGPVSTSIVNAQMSGAVNPTALEIKILAGGIDVTTLTGALKLQTTAGVANLGTLAGLTTIDGTSINIGTSAVHPAVKGDILLSLFGQLLTALLADARIGNLGAPVLPSPGLIAAINSINGSLSTAVSGTVLVQP